MGTCLVCDDHIPADELVDHLRVVHPDQYGDGPERWPDGSTVIYDMTLEPCDFAGDRPDLED